MVIVTIVIVTVMIVTIVLTVILAMVAEFYWLFASLTNLFE